jgi:hypothetical protein
MTASPDLSPEHLRETIVDGLQSAVDRLEGGYAAPLRRQLRAEGDVYDAAVLCLGLGSICGKETKTLPCALTLGLLEEMGRVFLSLEHGVGINADWGMPRTLNAADGLYTLAENLLHSHDALDTRAKLKALSIFHAAARELSEALLAPSSEGHEALQKAARSLYPAAADFAALCCGLTPSSRDDLVLLARNAADAPNGALEAMLVKASALLLRQA